MHFSALCTHTAWHFWGCLSGSSLPFAASAAAAALSHCFKSRACNISGGYSGSTAVWMEKGRKKFQTAPAGCPSVPLLMSLSFSDDDDDDNNAVCELKGLPLIEARVCNNMCLCSAHSMEFCRRGGGGIKSLPPSRERERMTGHAMTKTSPSTRAQVEQAERQRRRRRRQLGRQSPNTSPGTLQRTVQTSSKRKGV